MDLLKARLNGLFRYRYLIKQLVSKDIKLKYRRSFLGYLWSVLNPLLTMVIMMIVFQNIFRFDIENYPVYLIIGQTLFNFMNESTNMALTSINDNAALLKKTYVPKYVFAMSRVTSSLVNLLFALGAMVIVFIISKVHWSWSFLFIPIILLQLYLFNLGLGLFLAQANVFFRDVKHLYGTFIVAWTYLTPIFYPESILTDSLRQAVTVFNPLYSYISQFRTVIIDGVLPAAPLMISGWIWSIGAVLFGTWCFLKTQDRFILYI